MPSFVNALREFRHYAYPKKYRALHLAQSGLCPYCGGPLMLSLRDHLFRTTRDHVHAKSKGGRVRRSRNIVLAHALCNAKKSNRDPYPCEVLFLQVTNEIRAANAGSYKSAISRIDRRRRRV